MAARHFYFYIVTLFSVFLIGPIRVSLASVADCTAQLSRPSLNDFRQALTENGFYRIGAELTAIPETYKRDWFIVTISSDGHIYLSTAEGRVNPPLEARIQNGALLVGFRLAAKVRDFAWPVTQWRDAHGSFELNGIGKLESGALLPETDAKELLRVIQRDDMNRRPFGLNFYGKGHQESVRARIEATGLTDSTNLKITWRNIDDDLSTRGTLSNFSASIERLVFHLEDGKGYLEVILRLQDQQNEFVSFMIHL